MPFYEYQCRACGAHVEVLQKITDSPLKKCPECGQNKLAKQVSAPVFRLKGGGWYETDFKTDKDKKRNLVDSDKGEAKAEGKSDDKPAEKSEAKAEAKTEAKSRPVAKPVSTKSVKRPARKPARARARR